LDPQMRKFSKKNFFETYCFAEIYAKKFSAKSARNEKVRAKKPGSSSS